MAARGFRTRNALLLAALAAGATLGFGSRAGEADSVHASEADTRCDFTGDGIPDHVTGVPGKTVNGKKGAGAIIVRYRYPGLDISVGLASVGLTPATGNHYGAALACGDFNGDGDTDLAVGAPGYASNGGAIVVLYSNGTELVNPVAYTQNSPGVPGAREAGDRFGYALEAGDFNGDGKDDLAIGSPGESINHDGDTIEELGAVTVLKGSGSGLTTTGAYLFDPTGVSVGNTLPEDRGWFGFSLASGDFNADGKDDLAVGMPGGGIRDFHSHDEYYRVGLVYEMRGGSGQLATHAVLSQIFITDADAEYDELFGYALAVGDFDHNGKDDIAIGSPADGNNTNGECCTGGQGAVFLALHLNSTYAYEIIRQGENGVPGEAETNDFFGFSLAAGNFDGSGGDDLAIGVPGENGFGAVNIVYANGEAELIYQGTAGMPGVPEPGDRFGFALSAMDDNGDGYADLLIGAPGEDVDGFDDSGIATVVRGKATGLDDEALLDDIYADADLYDQESVSGFQEWDLGGSDHPAPGLTWIDNDGVTEVLTGGAGMGFSVAG